MKIHPKAVAAWEAGSAANGTTDQFSDIDLTVVGLEAVELFFEAIESSLNRISKIRHKWVEPKQFWPGCFQRVYILADSPKHFFVDVAVFLRESAEVLRELMEIERHGKPIVLFDKVGIIKPRIGDIPICFLRPVGTLWMELVQAGSTREPMGQSPTVRPMPPIGIKSLWDLDAQLRFRVPDIQIPFLHFISL